MENLILTVHLILAVILAGVVLLQRSEGGGLGMGGGGGGAGGVMSGRQAANLLTRMTWILGVAIFVTSITLTILAARGANNSSIMDQFGGTASQQAPATGSLPGLPAYTPPPTTSGNPLTPPSPDAPSPDAPVTDAPADSTAVVPVTPPATDAPAAEAEAPAAAPAEALTPPAPEAAAPAPTTPAPEPTAPAQTTPAPAN